MNEMPVEDADCGCGFCQAVRLVRCLRDEEEMPEHMIVMMMLDVLSEELPHIAIGNVHITEEEAVLH
jgi:hypothetical protein